MLLRYFLDHVSTFVSLFAAFPAHHSDRTLPQFDLCEPYRFFRYEVPQRARTNKTLANAILAISARMMHWKTGYNPYVADRYYQLCLETLIPSLSDVEAVMDETLLAATVVLRMLEEMDGSCPEKTPLLPRHGTPKKPPLGPCSACALATNRMLTKN